MKCFTGKKDKATVSQWHITNNERNANLQEPWGGIFESIKLIQLIKYLLN